MSLTQELRAANVELWERMVTHPFVEEMGDGTLPPEKFRRYFLQDYVFVKDLVPMIALGAAKAPSIEDGYPLVKFLAALGPENDLFQRAFAELGASEAEYSAASATPSTQAFGDFIMRTALQGQFIDIITILYVTEGTYLDWATRLLEAGRRPTRPKSTLSGLTYTALKCSVSWWNGYGTSSTTLTSAIAALKSSASSAPRCATSTASGSPATTAKSGTDGIKVSHLHALALTPELTPDLIQSRT